MRGGVVENIYARNLAVGQVAKAGLSIDFFYEEGPHGPFTPVVRNVEVRSLTVQQTRYALYLRGFHNAPIRDVRLTDCDFVHARQGNVIQNVEGLVLQNVRVNGRQLERNSTSAGGFAAQDKGAYRVIHP